MLCARRPVEWFGCLLATIWLAGCGGGATEPGPGGGVETIVAAGGGGQTGQTGTALSQPISVLVRSSAGNPLQGISVAWATSDGGGFSAPATPTGADGIAAVTWTLGGTAGSQTATASLSGAAGSPVTFSATAVVPSPSVTVTGVTPSPMVEGQAATITGTGFGASLAGLSVTIDGTSASILQVTPTTVLVSVPVSDCKPARTAGISVTLNAVASNPFTAPLAPSSFVTVPVGQEAILQDPANFCLQFNAGAGDADYLIGVQSTSEVVSNLTPITLTATSSGAGVVPLPSLSTWTSPATLSSQTLSSLQLEGAQRWDRHRAAEAKIRRAERALIGRAQLIRQGIGSGTSAAGAAVSFQVGDTVTGSVPDLSSGDLCTPIPVTAVVRTVGTRGIWLEDVNNPAGGYSSADFDALSLQLDNLIYSTDVSYFGEPTDLDGTGRIFILITKEVNQTPGLLGFVSATDLFSQASCASSNQGEIFYGVAPDPTGIYPSGTYSTEKARADAPFLIAHEFTHIIQQSRRLYISPGPLMANWTAEGQATLAEEVVGFAAEGHTVGQNLGFAVALNLDDPTSIDWYGNKITDLAVYFGFQGTADKVAGAPSECSWLDKAPANTGPCVSGREIYGVPWSLLRWLSDQYGPSYPGGETGLQQALINSAAVGYDNLASVVGVPIKTLLARWAAALYVDDRVPGADISLTIPSWNLYDIFDAHLDPVLRLAPVSHGFGTFTESANVRAGSTAYYRVSGSNSPATAIKVGGTGGVVLPSAMQVFLVRLR